MKKVLLYAPNIYRWDKGFQPPLNVDTWYYAWQRSLWAFLDSIGQKTIWKAGPRTNALPDPIRLLKSNRIRYSTRSLGGELRRCDMVFLDFPSTPLLEAVRVGLPVLCVSPIVTDSPVYSRTGHDLKGTTIQYVPMGEYTNMTLWQLSSFLLGGGPLESVAVIHPTGIGTTMRRLMWRIKRGG